MVESKSHRILCWWNKCNYCMPHTMECVWLVYILHFHVYGKNYMSTAVTLCHEIAHIWSKHGDNMGHRSELEFTKVTIVRTGDTAGTLNATVPDNYTLWIFSINVIGVVGTDCDKANYQTFNRMKILSILNRKSICNSLNGIKATINIVAHIHIYIYACFHRRVLATL